MAGELPDEANGPRPSRPHEAGGTPALPDEALAHALQQAGMVTFDQLEAARLEQAAQAKQGHALSLGDVLILQGVITQAILDNVAKKVQARAAGGIRALGEYKLLKKIGEGGMGQVFLAEDTHVGRTVAVKVLPKKLADDRQFLTRFRREAIATGKLNHVNIVCAYTVGEQDGLHYYAMEYCDGAPLDAVLKKVPFIPWDLATGVILQAARGLKHAHEHGIVHRDIKPANIFICRPPGTVGVSPAPESHSPLALFAEGFVAKILDLGLSKDLGNESSSFYTQTGVAMGTPHYISPEQAKGEKQIDGRTDIYSLGATYYHLVTGETPFTGTTGAVVMMKHLTEQLPNPQDVNDEVPDSVVHVIQRMMAKDPNDRYANCKELLEDLELVIDGKEPSSVAIDVGKSSVAIARRRTAGVPPAPAGRALLGTRRHAPVGTGRASPVERRSGREGEQVGGNASADKTLIYAGVGVFVLVLVGVLALAMGGGEKPATRAGSGEREEARTPQTTPTTVPTQPQPIGITSPAPADQTSRTLPKPRGDEWPLHDGKEAIANYAGRLGLPPAQTLDLGGGLTMEFVLVPAGEFEMGSNDGPAEEKPVHKVTIGKPYYIGKYEVTVAQWKAFADATKYQTEAERQNKGWGWKDGKWADHVGLTWRTPGFEQTAEHPVVLVSWNDAQEFCKWASKVAHASGLRGEIRLPTEAQWEYAARGPESRKYPWGAKEDWTLLNHADAAMKSAGIEQRWGSSPANDAHAYTAPAGFYKNAASWCGAFDMAGNVWEWVEDRFDANYYKNSPALDPPGPATGNDRVLRGGCWHTSPVNCRSARRAPQPSWGPVCQ